MEISARRKLLRLLIVLSQSDLVLDQGLVERLFAGQHAEQVRLGMMIHVFSGDIRNAMFGCRFRKIHGKCVHRTQKSGICRPDIRDGAAAILPDPNAEMALPSSSVILPVVDEAAIWTDGLHGG